MDLKEESEDIDLLGGGSGDDDDRPRNNEGRGFGGTLLGYSSSSSPPPTPPTQRDEASPDAAILSCPACTFMNAPDAFSCEMCETVLGDVPA